MCTRAGLEAGLACRKLPSGTEYITADTNVLQVYQGFGLALLSFNLIGVEVDHGYARQ